MARSLQVHKNQESKNYIKTNDDIDNNIAHINNKIYNDEEMESNINIDINEQINCNVIETNNCTDVIYNVETNRDIDINSNFSNDSEFDLFDYNDNNINSNKSDINSIIADELMAQENWRNKAEKPIKIKKEKTSSHRNIQVQIFVVS